MKKLAVLLAATMIASCGKESADVTSSESVDDAGEDIDIRQRDPRILHAMHGMDEWDFDEYCASITDFLEMLDIQID